MSSVKVLTIGKVVRDGNVILEKTYAFVFPLAENGTVAALLLRLQARPDFSGLTLAPKSVVNFNNTFGATVEVDAAYELVHLATYTVTFAFENSGQPTRSQVHGSTSATTTSSDDEKFILVFVKTFDGKTCTLQVKPSYTTKKVKLMLEEKGHARANCLRLIHGGKQLECHRTLSDSSVSREQTIHMVGRLGTNRRCGCVPK